jgi:hypothetical protein
MLEEEYLSIVALLSEPIASRDRVYHSPSISSAMTFQTQPEAMIQSVQKYH